MELERVKERFFRCSGEDPADAGPRGELCAQLCGECLDRAASLLKGRSARAGEAETAALESWAAAEAFYQLALRDEAVSPESVSADGMRIDMGARSEKARALADEKRREAALVLGEGAFYFGRV